MPDSEELDEILNEIKNINSPKPEKKEEEPTEFSIEEKNSAPKEEKPTAAPAEETKAAPVKMEKTAAEKAEETKEDKSGGLSFTDFDSYSGENKAEKSKAPQVIREEAPAELPTDKRAPKKKKSNKGIIIAIVAIVVVIAAVAAVFIVKNNGKTEETTAAPSESTSEVTTTAPVSTKNPLTGASDFNSSAVGKRPIACVVENAQAARPQWGIDDEDNPPDIIVEGEVEGGETRMLWMYADYTAVPSQIGPMRSARPPYIKFSELFDAIFLHWGMSRTKKRYRIYGS